MRWKPRAAERSPEPCDKGLRQIHGPSPQGPCPQSPAPSDATLTEEEERLGCSTQLPANYEVFPSSREETNTLRSSTPAAPRGVSSLPEAPGSGGALVTTHRSAPPLCPFPAALFEPVPALTGIRGETQRFPQPVGRGAFPSETAGSDAEPFPVRRIMNGEGRGASRTPCFLLVSVSLPHPRGLTGGERSSGRGFQR